MSDGSRGVALRAQDVSFTYPEVGRPALEDFSLEVREGSFLGLLGTNGSGKTTFVNLVCGLLSTASGRIDVLGAPAGSRRARRSIGLCPQELALYPTLTAEENLRLFGRLAGVRGPRLIERVQACLELAQLVAERGQRVASFSGGMKRRLNLAAALVHDPSLLLLDEPTVGVDPQSRIAIYESLEELSRAGTTILYTSHYMEEVERLCERVVVIDRGVRLVEGPTEEIVVHGQGSASFRLRLAPDRNAAALASELTGTSIRAQVLEDGSLELAGEDLAQLTAEVARLTERGDVVDCETHKPTLEESFLGLTGRELRD